MTCKCIHIKGEFCRKCWPPKKSAISLTIFISRIDKNLHVALDCNKFDLKDFGINDNQYEKLVNALEKSVLEILNN